MQLVLTCSVKEQAKYLKYNEDSFIVNKYSLVVLLQRAPVVVWFYTGARLLLYTTNKRQKKFGSPEIRQSRRSEGPILGRAEIWKLRISDHNWHY